MDPAEAVHLSVSAIYFFQLTKCLNIFATKDEMFQQMHICFNKDNRIKIFFKDMFHMLCSLCKVISAILVQQPSSFLRDEIFLGWDVVCSWQVGIWNSSRPSWHKLTCPWLWFDETDEIQHKNLIILLLALCLTCFR